MSSFLKSCRTLLVELFVYLWCNTTRLLFHLWFFWQRPQPLPPAKHDILMRSATSLAGAIRKGEVNVNALRVFFTETEGSLYFSRVTPDARQCVVKLARHLKEVGSKIHRLHVPELQHAIITWFKVSAIKDPHFFAKILGPSGLNVFVDLLRILVGAGRHTLATLAGFTIAPAFRFSSKQDAKQFLDSVDGVRDRLEEKLGDDGVLVLPAEPSTAPYHNQDLLFCDSAGMTALFSILKMPATVCPVMKSANGLPLAVQVVAKRGNDRLCLAVAREIERQFGGWIQPGVRN